MEVIISQYFAMLEHFVYVLHHVINCVSHGVFYVPSIIFLNLNN